VFEHMRVDSRRLAGGGFSDGASYALSLGVDNGDLFSPRPRPLARLRRTDARARCGALLLSHGTRDTVLPIAHCSRRIVPALRRANLDVEYHEFAGGHEIPADVARRAVEFLLR
jgi:predicted esterase